MRPWIVRKEIGEQIGDLAGTDIPDWQRTIHVVTEAASVLMVPWVLAAAKSAKKPHKNRLYFLGYSMLAVDGFLLLRWLTKKGSP